jgi:hypothetical protein
MKSRTEKTIIRIRTAKESMVPKATESGRPKNRTIKSMTIPIARDMSTTNTENPSNRQKFESPARKDEEKRRLGH